MLQVSEMTVLVVGLGGIGAQVARMLSALGASVIGTSRHARPVDHVDRIIHVEEIADTVADVDAIVLTLPGTAATEKLIGVDVLAKVRPGTIVVRRWAAAPSSTRTRSLKHYAMVGSASPLSMCSPLSRYLLRAHCGRSPMCWSARTRRP